MKIMIVDDETISRKILIQKMMMIGTCTAVEDSPAALNLFDKALADKEPFDLITLDISMPKMDGRQLLSIIRKKEKELKIPKDKRVRIIMVTSRMNVSTIKECIKLGCDGYITKPVNKYQLLGNLGRMGFAQPENIHHQEEITYSKLIGTIINRFYQGEIKLPVFPEIATQVQNLMDKEDSTLEDLARLIEKDILINTKLVFIANSPLYRGSEKVEDLNAALMRLGLKAASGAISTLVTRDLFKSGNKKLNDHLQKLWLHSFACGCIGKKIALEVNNRNPDAVFLMGIVHDIGKMLLIKSIADILPEETFEGLEVNLAIHEIHTTFGAALLKKMNFSKEFIHIAEFHHWNDFSKDDDRELLIIQLADYLASRTGYSFFKFDRLEEIDEGDAPADLKNQESLKQLGLSAQRAMEIADQAKAVIKESSAAF